MNHHHQPFTLFFKPVNDYQLILKQSKDLQVRPHLCFPNHHYRGNWNNFWAILIPHLQNLCNAPSLLTLATFSIDFQDYKLNLCFRLSFLYSLRFYCCLSLRFHPNRFHLLIFLLNLILHFVLDFPICWFLFLVDLLLVMLTTLLTFHLVFYHWLLFCCYLAGCFGAFNFFFRIMQISKNVFPLFCLLFIIYFLN